MTSPPARALGAPPGSEPIVPEVGMVCWVETTILPPGDPEERRPVVVVETPAAVGGTVTVVARTGTDSFGIEHPADLRLGLSSPGRFSRRHPVAGWAWTSTDVTPIGPLDNDVLAAVVARFCGRP